MIKNVLSIDIDFLFTECTEYSEMVDNDLTAEHSWQVIRWKTGNKSIKVNKESMSYILRILKTKCKDAEIVSITEHEEIMEVFRERNLKDTVLYNIDNHHDLGYTAILNLSYDCSNWVPHARHKGYIKEYNWIRQDDSKYPVNPQIQYKSGSYKDVGMERLPDSFDLVVICTSKYYTPSVYWCYNKLLCEYTFKAKNKFKYFEEIPIWKFPKVDKSKYPHYWKGDSAEPTRYFKYNDFYIEACLVDGVAYLSMINFGGSINLLTQLNDVLDYLIDHYGKIGFYSEKDFRNRKYTDRIAGRYSIVTDKEIGNMRTLILERGLKNVKSNKKHR